MVAVSVKSVQGLLAAHASSDHELAKAVLKALRPRDGRSQRCTRDELPERLEQDGVTFDPDELDEVLPRPAMMFKGPVVNAVMALRAASSALSRRFK